MLRWTKMSPGRAPVRTDSGTRESAHPNQRTWEKKKKYKLVVTRRRERYLWGLALSRFTEKAGLGVVDCVGPF